MLITRVLTALVLMPLMLAAIFLLPQSLFALAMAFMVLLGAWELANLASFDRGRWLYLLFVALVMLLLHWLTWLILPLMALAALWWLLAFGLIKQYPHGQAWWHARWIRALMGLLVLVPMWQALVQLRSHEIGPWLVLLLMLFVWSADIGAYFAGRRWGKLKLAPRVSPGKTWAGVLGAMVAAFVLALLSGFLLAEQYAWGLSQWLLWALGAMLWVWVSIVGDLFESMLKRYRGIKDSSQLLPGHGGVLDRIDSLTAAAPLFLLWLVLWSGLVPNIL